MKKELKNVLSRMSNRMGKRKFIIAIIVSTLLMLAFGMGGMVSSLNERKIFDHGKVVTATVTRVKGYGFFVTAVDVSYVVDEAQRTSYFYCLSIFESYRRDEEISIRYLPEDVHAVVSDVEVWRRSLLYVVWLFVPTAWFVAVFWFLVYAVKKEKRRLAETSASAGAEATDSASTP